MEEADMKKRAEEVTQMFNEELLTDKEIQNKERVSVPGLDDIGAICYDAGNNFSMLITGRGKRENTEEAYNRWNFHSKEGGKDFFCASYIRNDMLGTYTQEYFYGFNQINSGTLLRSGQHVGSNYNDPTNQYVQTFEEPNAITNMTSGQIGFNELNITRGQEPDFFVAFKFERKDKIYEFFKKCIFIMEG